MSREEVESLAGLSRQLLPAVGGALLLFGVGAAVALHDLARANRPHELEHAWVAALAFGGSAALTLRAIARAWADGGAQRVAALMLLGPFAAVALYLTLSAAWAAIAAWTA